MGREYEEGLIRNHQPEKLQIKRKKKSSCSNLLNDLVHGRIALGVSSRSGEPNFEVGAATFRGKI